MTEQPLKALPCLALNVMNTHTTTTVNLQYFVSLSTLQIHVDGNIQNTHRIVKAKQLK